MFNEIRDLCLLDKAKLDEMDDEEAKRVTPYWICQPYIRPDPDLATTQREDLKRELQSKLDQIGATDQPQVQGGGGGVSTSIKRQIHELTSEIEVNQEPDDRTTKMVKLLERKRRKREKCERKQRQLSQLMQRGEASESGQELTKEEQLKRLHELVVSQKKPTKYVLCSNCKNPRGENCAHSLCRSCCKEKVFTDQVDCKGELTVSMVTAKSKPLDSTRQH